MSKNNDAWTKIFQELDILSVIESNGFFEISSKDINKYRQSRLMAKFDTKSSFPKIFLDNNLSILPISRNKYVIGKFITHHYLQKNKFKSIYLSFPAPPYETLDPSHIYSENSALHLARVSGCIDYLIQDKNIQLTISGRMRTGIFDFSIQDSTNLAKDYKITVQDSQCEIDAGFESESHIYLIEAKNHNQFSDFIVRQLYYPFRLWSSKTRKKVIPVLMTYSNNTFDFYVFNFEDTNSYNSLKETVHLRCTLQPEPISFTDLDFIFKNVSPRKKTDIPLPQATAETTIDLLNLLYENSEVTKQEIVEKYKFAYRQGDYYVSSGKYFGLVEKISDKPPLFRLTSRGQSIFKKNLRERYLKIVESVLRESVFYSIYRLSRVNYSLPTNQQVQEVIKEHYSDLAETTVKRRATTVRNWIRWILELTNDDC